MSNSFNFVGRLSIPKQTEKFKPYEKIEFEGKDYYRETFKFNVIAGDNRHMMSINSFVSSVIYTLGKEKDENGKSSIQIPYVDRNKPESIEKVAGFKIFTIDLEKPKRRYAITRAIEKLKSGEDISEDELSKKFDLPNDIEELKTLLEKSNKLKKEFIHEGDFIHAIKKVIESGKYTESLFNVRGNLEYTTNASGDKFYENFVPQKIYLSDKEPSSEANLDFIFTKDCVEVGKTKTIVNGFVSSYDNRRKKNIFAPVTLALEPLDEKQEKINKVVVKQLETAKKGKYKQIGLKIDVLNGSQKVKFDISLLNDFQKEMYEIGALTEEEIMTDLMSGDNKSDLYGDQIKEMVILNVSRGNTKGAVDTMYTSSDMVVEALEIRKDETSKEEDTSVTEETPAAEDDDDDIFGDDF